jgi:hypothetical protein
VSVPPSSSSGGTSGGTSGQTTSPQGQEHDDPPSPTPTPTPDAGTGTPPSGSCAVSFQKNILPALNQAGCGGVACHGTRFGQAPRIETADAKLTYDALVAYKIANKPYVKQGGVNPDDSAMHCHFHGQCGAKMPPGGGTIPAELVTAADAWLACGAPNN